ncbi:HNH endonuclease signature motif containing protein [Rhizobium brockwellii]|uniref:HNH endonuclease signature motif containing protein n=1 Tax=Rhizobium brockwellii TaxID=3019932 RepID=A0ABU3YMR8_9HYPH|nr:HNH endonuclease signature motif containing protein [Rhizobium brockwellii]MDV4180218.1 HNH endonuclease signature motif containing protein [Rhizobium brockwellii]MDV4187140.1 HNH endonuclease signature motif containing protein [Rhizobium brockwellii]
MKNLQLPSREQARADLERALSTYRYRNEIKGYQASEEEIDALMEIYDVYDGARGALSQALEGQALGQEVLAATHGAFDQMADRRRLAYIRKDLLRNVDRCPICGIMVAKELDHFLPRSKYKPLAIYRRNLVPLCHDCNNIKSDRAGDGDAANFVHAYFDSLPDRDLIRATAEIEGEALTVQFEVTDDEDVSPALIAKLKYQLTTLRLPDRFTREINNYLSSHTPSLHLMWQVGGGESGVRLFLNRQIIAETATHHRNDWRVATLKALANHAGFCEGGFQAVLPLPPELQGTVDAIAVI